MATVRFRARSPVPRRSWTSGPRPCTRWCSTAREVDPASLSDGRLPLVDLRPENELVVTATMPYSHDGQGLHRSVDPADGEHYVYGHLFLDAAPRVFACFDQPDLKAPVRRAPSRAPATGSSSATARPPGRRRARGSSATTQPLATYFVTVCAGPYASVRDEHDGIPLGIHARASLRTPSSGDADQMLEVTRQSLRLLPRAVRHPLPVRGVPPGVRAGVQRRRDGEPRLRDASATSTSSAGRRPRDEVLTRVQHHRPRDGAHVVRRPRDHDSGGTTSGSTSRSPSTCRTARCVDATEFTDAWVDSAMARKAWGYAAERHPVDPPRRRVAGARRRSRRCRTSTASPTPRARPRCAS